MKIKLVCMNLHNLKEEERLGRLFIVCPLYRHSDFISNVGIISELEYYFCMLEISYVQ